MFFLTTTMSFLLCSNLQLVCMRKSLTTFVSSFSLIYFVWCRSNWLAFVLIFYSQLVLASLLFLRRYFDCASQVLYVRSIRLFWGIQNIVHLLHTQLFSGVTHSLIPLGLVLLIKSILFPTKPHLSLIIYLICTIKKHSISDNAPTFCNNLFDLHC